MKRVVVVLVLALVVMGLPANQTPGVDFYVLIDMSLSMEPIMTEVKALVIDQIVGQLLGAGDRVTVLAFHGSSSTIWQGDIQSEADISALSRTIQALEANGRYTDIGRVLDAATALIASVGPSDRLIHLMMISDGIQEAPATSPYYVNDFMARHALMAVSHRQHHGSFYTITFAYGMADKINAAVRLLQPVLNRFSAPNSPAQAGWSVSDGQSWPTATRTFRDITPSGNPP